jgi:hypothetical protein
LRTETGEGGGGGIFGGIFSLQSDEGDRGTGDRGKNPEMHVACMQK